MKGLRQGVDKIRSSGETQTPILAFLHHQTILTKSTFDAPRPQTVFLKVLHVKEVFASLDKVSFAFFEGKLDIQFGEEGEHDVKLSNLAILIQGGHVDILGEFERRKSLREGIAKVGKVGKVGPVSGGPRGLG